MASCRCYWPAQCRTYFLYTVDKTRVGQCSRTEGTFPYPTCTISSHVVYLGRPGSVVPMRERGVVTFSALINRVADIGYRIPDVGYREGMWIRVLLALRSLTTFQI